MKYGVLQFSYTHFQQFETRLAETGLYSINLGDYMQTLAVRHLYGTLGVAAEDVVAIDRDCLSRYDGPPAILPMNACFYRWCFPLPEQIVPVFVGFQAKGGLIKRRAKALGRYGPIGCRDRATEAACKAAGLDAFVTGCLTLSLPPRTTAPPQNAARVLCIFGQGAGRLPMGLLEKIPSDLHGVLDLISQRRDMVRFPLTQADRAEAEKVAHGLLDRYRREARAVITPLHHAATPALASGIPVALCRATADDRFSWLQEVLPLHVAPNFDTVDWSFPNRQIDHIRHAQSQALSRGIDAALDRAQALGLT